MFKLLFVASALFVCLSSATSAQEAYKHEDFVKTLKAQNQGKEYVTKEDVKKILFNANVDPYSISTVLNDYADKVFKNIQEFMVKIGVDPFAMPEVSQEMLGLHINLTNGWIQDLSTIHRGGDVVVIYDPSTKILEMDIPIAFDSMQFTYDMKAHWLLLNADGDISGAAHSVTVKTKITFDLNTYTAALVQFDVHTGSLDMTIHSGHAIGDTFLNLIMDVTTFLFKGIIEFIIDQVVGSVMRSVVQLINDTIQDILHPDIESHEFMQRLMEQASKYSGY